MAEKQSNPMNSIDLWDKYVKTPVDERRFMINEILKDKEKEQDLRRLMFYFGSDRPAYLQIFRKWVTNQAESMRKSNGTLGYHTVSDILDRCKEEATEHGVIYDVEKATIAYGILISIDPQWGLDLAWNPQIFQERTEKAEQEMKKYAESIEKRPFLVSFSMPVGYVYNEDEDKNEYATGYPQEDLRKIEREYLTINHNNSDMDEEPFNALEEHDSSLPLRTTLSFSEDGKTASFKFFTNDDCPEEKRHTLIDMAKEWLEGQLSDGFAEDMNRFCRLIDKENMTPYFFVDEMREEDVIFAGAEKELIVDSTLQPDHF